MLGIVGAGGLRGLAGAYVKPVNYYVGPPAGTHNGVNYWHTTTVNAQTVYQAAEPLRPTASGLLFATNNWTNADDDYLGADMVINAPLSIA